MKNEIFQKIFFNILDNDYLLAVFLLNIIIKPTKNIETLAISFNSQFLKYQIEYNPDFLLSLESKEQIAVFKHEIYHLLFKHFIRIRNIKNLDHKIANIAMDIAINQYIKDLPKNALYPETFQLPKNLTFEEYYDILYNQINQSFKLKENIMKLDSIDVHKDIENVNNNEENDDIRTKETSINNLIEKAYKIMKKKQSNNKNYTDTEKLLYKIKKFSKSEINIKKILKNNILKEIQINLKNDSSWLKINRRFDYMKGKKKKKIIKFLIAVDTSYSLDLIEINDFLNEIYKTFDKIYDFYEILFFHHEIYKILKKSKKLSNITEIEQGGTSFQPVLNYAKKKSYEYIIIFTDGYGDNLLNLYKKNVIFINNKLNKYKIFKKKLFINASNIFK